MLNDLFSLLDANGDGAISKSEFGNALGAGGTNVAAADSVFARMDKDGDGAVSANELAKVLSEARRGLTPAGAATSSYNEVEQAIQRQAQVLASPTAGSLSVSV